MSEIIISKATALWESYGFKVEHHRSKILVRPDHGGDKSWLVGHKCAGITDEQQEDLLQRAFDAYLVGHLANKIH
mgnify:FL=1|jgi:hypothetical protein